MVLWSPEFSFTTMASAFSTCITWGGRERSGERRPCGQHDTQGTPTPNSTGTGHVPDPPQLQGLPSSTGGAALSLAWVPRAHRGKHSSPTRPPSCSPSLASSAPVRAPQYSPLTPRHTGTLIYHGRLARRCPLPSQVMGPLLYVWAEGPLHAWCQQRCRWSRQGTTAG